MPQAARLSDVIVGICCCHPTCIGVSGQIVTHSLNVVTNGLGQARLGDIAIGSCGHTTMIVTSSQDTIVNGVGAARLTDSVAGCITGQIVTGSPNTIING